MTDSADVTPVQAVALVADGAVLLDVRESEEWDMLHSPLATHLVMGDVAEGIGSLPSGVPILCVCHMGGRSAVVAQALRDAGWDARNVDGGMTAWVAAGLAVVDGHGHRIEP